MHPKPLLHYSLIYFLVFCFLFNHAFAQSGGQSAPNLIPPSPEAASLGKYVEIPVSYYTGIPEISIPIHSIQTGSLQAGISLNYHAAGIRLEEIPSWVGSGWALNAGSIISRIVRGKPDDSEINGGFLEFSKNRSLQTILQLPEAERLDLYNEIAQGCQDAEPDVFYLNVNGITAKMMFKWNNEGLAISCDRKIKVNCIRQQVAGFGWPRITGWDVIDESGNIYKFRATEQTSNQAPGATACNAQEWFNSSWYLSEMSDVNGENQLFFTYDSYTLDYGFRGSQTRKFGLSNGSSIPCLPYAPAAGVTEDAVSRTIIHGLRIKEIRSADGTAKISFVAGAARTDQGYLSLPPGGFTSGFRLLDKIIVRNRDSAEIQTFQLGHDYSTGRLTLKSVQLQNNGQAKSPAYELTYIGGLPGLTPSASLNAQDHWGFYNGAGNTTLIPSQWITTTGGDLLSPGANREPDSIAMKMGSLSKIKYPTGGLVEFDFEPNEYGFIQNQPLLYYKKAPANFNASVAGNTISTPTTNTTPFTIHANPLDAGERVAVHIDWSGFSNAATTGQKAWVKILDPAGQTIYFNQFAEDPDHPGVIFSGSFDRLLAPGNYQLQAYCRNINGDFATITTDFRDYSSQQAYKKYGGGLRIREIREFAWPADPAFATRRFTYQQNDSSKSSGVIYQEPLYTYPVNYYCYQAGNLGNTLFTGQYLVSVAQNKNVLGTTQGSHLGYREVQVFYGKAGALNGKKVVKFSSPYEYGDDIYLNLPFRPEASAAFKTGLPLEETDYNTGTQPPQAVKQVQTSHLFKEQNVNGLRIMKTLLSGGLLYPDFFLVGDYTNILGYSKTGTVTEKIYSQSQPAEFLTQTSVNLYDAELKNLKSQILTGSDGRQTVSAIYYPEDYSTPNPAITKMIELNMRGVPVETITKIKEGNIESVVGGLYKLFSYTGNKMRVQESKTLKTAEPIALSGFDLSINTPLAVPDSRYEKDMLFNQFDNRGNVLQYTGRDGVPVCFVWAYNQTLPVARITGATYNEVLAALNQSDPALPYLQWMSNSSLATEMNILRNTLKTAKPLAQVSSYTYIPQAGMATETDANGKTITYEYDAFNRLRTVRDPDGNILKRICYNYQGMPENCNQ